MVLINNLTIDEINAALLHLQRSSGEIVGGDKGRTVNNISVSNSGGGGIDYQSVINSLKKRLSQVETTNTEQQTQINEILLTLGNLADNGIQDFDYDENSGELTITTKDGEEYTVVIRSPTSTLTFDATTKKLTFTFNDDITEITLPYVASSEKGAANGVATLDATGRVPYSQLPESAMEFKGEWNAYTNTPHLQDGTGTNGDFYVCTVGGTVNFGTVASPRNITFYVNDRVIYEGNSNQWFRLPASEVRTVNGQSGDVVLTGENVNYSNASGSPTLKDKIDSVQQISETQADWSQTTSSAVDFIKNKPNLATVATSGSYNDLSNKPTIPAAQIQSDWTQTDNTKKDFIKNKIPIWITSGSADDNMSPIDSVTDGSMRPVTSNAVHDALLNLPYAEYVELPTNANMNDYRDSKKIYGQVTPSVINSFVNAPSFSIGNGEMSMIYINLGHQNYGMQLYFAKHSLDLAVVARVYNNGTWSAWSKDINEILGTSYNDSSMVNITSQLTRFLGVGPVYARRMNNMVYIIINGAYTGNPTTTSQQFIQGLPQKYRPKYTIEGLVLLGYNASQYATVARARIYDNGNITLQETSWANGTEIRSGLIYFVD